MLFIPVPEAAKACGAALFPILQRGDPSPLAACGCLGFLGVFVVAIVALNIAMLVWVAKDAKNRGMDNPIVWMILVMFAGIIGLVIYLCTRPSGNLVPCGHCANKRLPVSARCPHCGNA